MRIALALLVASFGLGCAWLPSEPGGPAEPWLAWQAPLGRADALAGRIYDTEGRRFVSPAEVFARARGAAFVLLGEKHDNPDHHRLQASLVESLAQAGRRPALVFEMIPRDRAGALDAAIAAHPDDPDALATALDWVHGGWPDFALYRPIFAAALEARMPIVPGDLSREQLAGLRKSGLDALSEAARARLALEPPPSAEARRAFADEVREAHCGMAPDAMVDAMIAVQRARDATLADALLASAGADGGVLIAGAGHVRRDRGAPLYLARRAPEQRVLALAFSEVPRGAAETDDPARRAAELGSEFDLVWFTPRVDDEDPCERFRHELEKLRQPKSAPPAP
ncbi:MAG: ChaN family lipoprotein [Myxococcota bacterium]